MKSSQYLNQMLANWKEFFRCHKKVEKAITGVLEENNQYKLALFVVIRNNILIKDPQLDEKEVNKIAVKTMEEMLSMIDYVKAEKTYKQATKEGV